MQGENIKIGFYHSDMSNFHLNKKYELVFVRLSSILYLHTDKQLQNCFESVRRHLTRRGEFIFAVFNPSRRILDLSPNERYEIKRFIDPANKREVRVEQSNHYDVTSRVNYATHYYSYSDQKDFFSHPVHLRILFPQDITNLIALSGFEMIDLYGNYRGAPFTNHSAMQLVVCRPK